MPKPVETLQPTDFANNAVWRFTSSDEPDETYVSRVRNFPLKESDSCILGTDVVLANGTKLIGYVGNLNPRSPTQNETLLDAIDFWWGRDSVSSCPIPRHRIQEIRPN